jgi:hypothetical protein
MAAAVVGAVIAITVSILLVIGLSMAQVNALTSVSSGVSGVPEVREFQCGSWLARDSRAWKLFGSLSAHDRAHRNLQSATKSRY